MDKEKHCGWSNFETWAVALHIDNTRESYVAWRSRARKLWEGVSAESIEDRRSQVTGQLADELCQSYHDKTPRYLQSPFTELLNGGLSEVDFHEIASELIAEIGEGAAPQGVDDTMGEVISEYSRSEALDDGVLIDLTKLAKEAGFRVPVAITSAAWADCIAVDAIEEQAGQDETGRTWDVLNVLRCAAKDRPNGNEVPFKVSVFDGERSKTVDLKSICGPGDDGAPVLTIMLPNED